MRWFNSFVGFLYLRRGEGGGMFKVQNHLSFSVLMIFLASSFKETVDINIGNKTRICESIIDI